MDYNLQGRVEEGRSVELIESSDGIRNELTVDMGAARSQRC